MRIPTAIAPHALALPNQRQKHQSICPVWNVLPLLRDSLTSARMPGELNADLLKMFRYLGLRVRVPGLDHISQS